MKKLVLLSILTIVLLSACEGPFSHKLRGDGNYVSETRNISGFNAISSEGEYNVVLTQADSFSVRVDAEENLLAYIKTDVVSSTLVIKTRNNRNIKPNKDIVVYITAPDITSIILSGSGNIDAENIETDKIYIKLSGSGNIYANTISDELYCKISGSGNINLAGVTSDGELSISGSGNIQSYSLEQDRCFATISGSGNIYASVNALLDVKISGSGSVHYVGTPSVNTSITGSGSVINNN